jgi:hypothetical protein
MSAGAIRAGRAFVEIFAADSAFQQSMTRIRTTMATMGQQLRRAGTGTFFAGAGLGAPLMLAVRSAASFENALFDARASAGLTAAEVDKIKQKSLELSKAGLGGPAAIAQAFTALVKAGMPLEDALGGAAEAVVKFAANAGIDVTTAAETRSHRHPQGRRRLVQHERSRHSAGVLAVSHRSKTGKSGHANASGFAGDHGAKRREGQRRRHVTEDDAAKIDYWCRFFRRSASTTRTVHDVF